MDPNSQFQNQLSSKHLLNALANIHSPFPPRDTIMHSQNSEHYSSRDIIRAHIVAHVKHGPLHFLSLCMLFLTGLPSSPVAAWKLMPQNLRRNLDALTRVLES